MLEPRHDLGHPIEADTAWSESYYFNGFDPTSDSGLFTRIGVRPNEGTMDVGLACGSQVAISPSTAGACGRNTRWSTRCSRSAPSATRCSRPCARGG